MSYYGILKAKIYHTFQWPTGDENHKAYDMTERNARIVQHYASEVDLGRMDTISAYEHCVGDICGRSYNAKDQRNSPIIY